jgi:Cys-rich protein (TIGR01571 family)
MVPIALVAAGVLLTSPCCAAEQATEVIESQLRGRPHHGKQHAASGGPARSLPQQDFHHADKSRMVTVVPFFSDLATFCVWAIVVACLAYYYKSYGGKDSLSVYEPGEPTTPLVDDKNTWRYGLFSCFDVPKLCCFSCCCGTIRWSDTMSMAGLIEYMNAVGCLLCLSGLSSLTGFLCFPVQVGIYTYFRQQLRQKFGMAHGDCSTVTEDCCTYTWCQLCAVTQEARQVEDATKEGFKFEDIPVQQVQK